MQQTIPVARDNPLRLLQFSTYDGGGGAERVATRLHARFRSAGFESRLLVRRRLTSAEGIAEIDAYTGTSPVSPLWRAADRIVSRIPVRGRWRAQHWIRHAALPRRMLSEYCGRDDFDYPGTAAAIDAYSPDVIQVHNIHGSYVDLRTLAGISRRLPVVWTLHDAWALTGHCAYFIDCERWSAGCGRCPDLQRPPAIRRDATAANWKLKRDLYVSARFALVTPSEWLMQRARPIFPPSTATKVIPLSVDTVQFAPGDRAAARRAVGIDKSDFVVLFAAASGHDPNPYKDFPTVAAACRVLATDTGERRVSFVCLGGHRRAADYPFRFPGYIHDAARLRQYYQAADVFVYAAHADNFPGVVLEAMSCGLPVVATAVGGVPEQVADGVTGILVGRGDVGGVVRAVRKLRSDADLKAHFSRASIQRVSERYTVKREFDDYLSWYERLLGARRSDLQN